MGTTERKEREKEQKRSYILEAAEQLILEKGLDQLNMDEVAERAEVSKGSLYLYFKNKTDLVLGICHKASDMLTNEFSQVLTREVPGIQMIHMIGEAFLKFVRAHPEYYKAMRFFDNLKENQELEDSEFLALCQENKHSSFAYMVRAIQIGMQDGSINSSYDPKELAVLLWGSSHGMVHIAFMHDHNTHFQLMNELEININSLLENFMKLIGCGIASDEQRVNYDSGSFFETQSK